MLPDWLSPPPKGLTDAERRVLEAFFVTEEVKPSAQLLSLSPKTVQNELGLARQTMNEGKSWAAAIRYVFYAKRHGHPFIEDGLVPRIDRQVRRLIDDYLEVEESREPENTVSMRSDIVPSNGGHAPSEVPADLLEEEPAKREKVLSGSIIRRDENQLYGGSDVPDDVFEHQLAKLSSVAIVRFQKRAWARSRPKHLALVAALLLVAIGWGFVAMNLRPMDRTEIVRNLSVVESQIKTSGANEARMRESASLVALLADEYWKEMWGRNESIIVQDIEEHEATIRKAIEWSIANDKRLALRILGNGHRGFNRVAALREVWIPHLEVAIKANPSDTSVHMVRAQCGIIFAWAMIYIKSDNENFRNAKENVLKIADQSNFPHDYANALRHVAMTQNDGSPPLRVANIKRAQRLYEALGDEAAKRGIGQCLLSLAQSGEPSHAGRIDYAVEAFETLISFRNDYVLDECVKEMATLSHALVTTKELETPGFPETLRRAREALWKHALDSSSAGRDERQFKCLLACFEIDAKIDRDRIGETLKALVDCQEARKNKHNGDRNQLAGFLFAEMGRSGRPPTPEFKEQFRNKNLTFNSFDLGSKLTLERALVLASKWGPREPNPE